jgi:hypothetical protein
VVSANPMRRLGFTRSNARPGEEAVGAVAIFQATDVREATADERWALLEARTVSKLQAKQRQAASARSWGSAAAKRLIALCCGRGGEPSPLSLACAAEPIGCL